MLLAPRPVAQPSRRAERKRPPEKTPPATQPLVSKQGWHPAKVAEATSATDAMARIAAAQATFVSRGDDSGTNALEKKLWKAAGITPQRAWYVESGTGMGDTLNIASERNAYTLSDRGAMAGAHHAG